MSFKASDLRRKGLAKGEVVTYRAPGIPALYARAQTTDRHVFYQIFVLREYRCLDHVRNPRLIVDCGAYVGYSSAYFAARFPQAQIVAVEPDPGNFALLAKNLEPYGKRCNLIPSGLWSKTCGLVMSDHPPGDELEWAYQVRESKPGERPTMQAVDVPSLLRDSGHERISILKIDVEGAEAQVFSRPCEWLDKVDNLVIELHGEKCERIFLRAIEGAGFSVSQCEELTVCVRDGAVRH
jgi:FkbM family methyltransferase